MLADYQGGIVFLKTFTIILSSPMKAMIRGAGARFDQQLAMYNVLLEDERADGAI